MANILGISVGTRNVGMAVIRLRKLTDYRIRTFHGKWTLAKCESIWDVIERVMKDNQVTDIVLKVPPPSHSSENLIELIGGIKGLADWYGIKLHRCTIQDLKLSYSTQKKSGKQLMVASLIEKYPDLKKSWHGGKQAKSYNAKLFEAIACAELALRAGH